MELSLPNSSSEYQVLEAVIHSDRSALAVDIHRLIIEFQIYEHIEKPWLTMKLIFIDKQNILQDVDFQGGEKLSMRIRHNEETTLGQDIVKDFVIDKIDRTLKLDERTQSVHLHCTEYHAFISSAQNVNISDKGAPSEISKRILEKYLDLDVVIDGEDSVNDMKVIVPNLNPLEAAMWLTKRTTTKDGLPFFLYSALGVNNLILKDLQKMLEQKPGNIDTPYFYAPSMESNKTKMNLYLISKYTHNAGENLLRRIRAGIVGAQYKFIDTYHGLTETVDFDVDNVFQGLVHKQLLGGRNTKYAYSPGYVVKDKPLSENTSTVISKITSSGAYRSNDKSYRSFEDETVRGNQSKRINRYALKTFLSKSPLTITVKGREFLTGDQNYTIGKTIRVHFLDTKPNTEAGKAELDQKKSGDYIIMGAKHNFVSHSVITHLLCGKVASLGTDAASFGGT